MPGSYSRQQRTLVDAFFYEQDQRLRKAFVERMEKMNRRAQLAEVSGIHDEAVLDRLIELDIGPETLVAIEVIPLVVVAWADGIVQAKEREAILAAAAAAGIQPKDGRYPLLEHWLKKRPDAEMIEAWKQYIRSLCQRLDRQEQEIERLKHNLLAMARNIAQAAGGFLGLGNKISAAENRVLGELEQAFS